jgi:hypothetical protein
MDLLGISPIKSIPFISFIPVNFFLRLCVFASLRENHSAFFLLAFDSRLSSLDSP